MTDVAIPSRHRALDYLYLETGLRERRLVFLRLEQCEPVMLDDVLDPVRGCYQVVHLEDRPEPVRSDRTTLATFTD